LIRPHSKARSAGSRSASSERFDYALAPGEVLVRGLTVRAGDRTVRIYSPDSRLQPAELVVPDPQNKVN